MQLVAFHKFVDLKFLPPTNHTMYVINTHRHALERCHKTVWSDYGFTMFVALMMAVDYNVLPPHTVITHWLVM